MRFGVGDDMSANVNRVKNMDSDGGGTMEVRLVKLETQVVHISHQVSELRLDVKDLRKEMHEDIGELRKDHKWLLGFFITVAIFLLSAFGIGYNLLDQKIDTTNSQMQALTLQMQSFSDKTAENFAFIQQQLQKIAAHKDGVGK